LTQDHVIQQTFDQPGEYILTLNVFNSISSVYHKQSVQVYGKLVFNCYSTCVTCNISQVQPLATYLKQHCNKTVLLNVLR